MTVGQYCQFLNAVAATDTYGLYNNYMGERLHYSTVGIMQNGSPGSYTYSVSYTASAWNPYVAYNPSLYPLALAAANDAPVFDVTWGDSARFANWLQNGQPTNLGEAAGSTETGAYTLNGATSQSALMAISRNAGATYFIPSENEWYKAAYFNPSNEPGTGPTRRRAIRRRATCCRPRERTTPTFYTSAYTDPTNLPDAGGRICRLARPLRHVTTWAAISSNGMRRTSHRMITVVCGAAFGSTHSSYLESSDRIDN